jgi:hypothetical protein
VLGCEVGVLEVVEQPELFLEQEERPVGLLDLAELGQLVDRLLGGALQKRSAGALDPLAVLARERSWAFHRSRRIWSTARWPEANDVERVKADIRVRDQGCDRLAGAADGEGSDHQARRDRVVRAGPQRRHLAAVLRPATKASRSPRQTPLRLARAVRTTAVVLLLARDGERVGDHLGLEQN